MPSRSAKQAKYMRAVAHGWKPKGKKAPSVKVAKEFNRADQKNGLIKQAMNRRANHA